MAGGRLWAPFWVQNRSRFWVHISSMSKTDLVFGVCRLSGFRLLAMAFLCGACGKAKRQTPSVRQLGRNFNSTASPSKPWLGLQACCQTGPLPAEALQARSCHIVCSNYGCVRHSAVLAATRPRCQGNFEPWFRACCARSCVPSFAVETMSEWVDDAGKFL